MALTPVKNSIVQPMLGKILLQEVSSLSRREYQDPIVLHCVALIFISVDSPLPHFSLIHLTSQFHQTLVSKSRSLISKSRSIIQNLGETFRVIKLNGMNGNFPIRSTFFLVFTGGFCSCILHSKKCFLIYKVKAPGQNSASWLQAC